MNYIVRRIITIPCGSLEKLSFPLLSSDKHSLFSSSGRLSHGALFIISSLFDKYLTQRGPVSDTDVIRTIRRAGYLVVKSTEQCWSVPSFNGFQKDLGEEGIPSEDELTDLISQFPLEEVYPFANDDNQTIRFSFDLFKRLYEVQGFDALSTDLEKLCNGELASLFDWKVPWNGVVQGLESSGSVSSSQDFQNKVGDFLGDSSAQSLIREADSCLDELRRSLQGHPDLYGKLRAKIVRMQDEKSHCHDSAKKRHINASEFAKMLQSIGATVNKSLSVVMLLRMGGTAVRQNVKVRSTFFASELSQKQPSCDGEGESQGDGACSRFHSPELSRCTVRNEEKLETISSSRIEPEQLLNALSHFRRPKTASSVKKWANEKDKKNRKEFVKERRVFHRAVQGSPEALEIVCNWSTATVRRHCVTLGGLSETSCQMEAARKAADYVNSSTGKASIQKRAIHLMRNPEDAEHTDVRELCEKASSGDRIAEKELSRKLRCLRFEEMFDDEMKNISGDTNFLYQRLTEFLTAYKKSRIALSFENWIEENFEAWKDKQQKLKTWQDQKLRNAEKMMTDSHNATLLSVVEERLSNLVNKATVETVSGGVTASMPVREGLDLNSRLRELQKLAYKKNRGVRPQEQIITKGEFNEVMHPLLTSLIAYPATSMEAKSLLDARGVAREKAVRMSQHRDGISQLCKLCGRDFSDDLQPGNLPADFLIQAEDAIYAKLLRQNSWFDSSDSCFEAASKNFEVHNDEVKGAYHGWLRQKKESLRESKRQKEQEETEKKRKLKAKNRANRRAFKKWKQAAVHGMYYSRGRSNSKHLFPRPKPGEGIPTDLPDWQHVCPDPLEKASADDVESGSGPIPSKSSAGRKSSSLLSSTRGKSSALRRRPKTAKPTETRQPKASTNK